MSERQRNYSFKDRLSRASGHEAWVSNLDEGQTPAQAFVCAGKQVLFPVTSELEGRGGQPPDKTKITAVGLDLARLAANIPIAVLASCEPEIIVVLIASQVATNMFANEAANVVVGPIRSQ